MVSRVGRRADIQYVKGDATDPLIRPAAILHVCNDVGAWGAEFVMALSQRWVLPEQTYRNHANIPDGLKLGSYQLVNVELGNILVFNMIAQVVLRGKNNHRPLHCGYLSHGLAGGDWNVVEALITDCLAGFRVYVYDL